MPTSGLEERLKFLAAELRRARRSSTKTSTFGWVSICTALARLVERNEDIEIVYTGTRPGEKLFEQLCDESERRTGTSHPKIMVVEAARPELVEILAAINCLAGKMNGPAATIVAQLQQILPGFRHPAPTGPRIRPTERTAA